MAHRGWSTLEGQETLLLPAENLGAKARELVMCLLHGQVHRTIIMCNVTNIAYISRQNSKFLEIRPPS